MLSAGIMLNGTERRRGGTYVPHAWINIAGDNLHNDFFYFSLQTILREAL